MLSGMIPPVNNDPEKTEEEEEPDLEKS
ncbi:phage tail protein, partial [Klebsiella pneumoniae]|nr:phage tail protein [Klebsiella pneumoniae]